MRYGAWTFGAVRKGSMLFPASERAERIIREMPFNKQVLLEARTARNAKHHDQFWGILDALVDATGKFPNSEKLNNALKMQLGITDEFWTLDGEVHIMPGSTAWSAMPNEQFNDYFDKAMAIIGEHFFPSMTREQVAKIEGIQAGELGRRAARGGRGTPNGETD